MQANSFCVRTDEIQQEWADFRFQGYTFCNRLKYVAIPCSLCWGKKWMPEQRRRERGQAMASTLARVKEVEWEQMQGGERVAEGTAAVPRWWGRDGWAVYVMLNSNSSKNNTNLCTSFAYREHLGENFWSTCLYTIFLGSLYGKRKEGSVLVMLSKVLIPGTKSPKDQIRPVLPHSRERSKEPALCPSCSRN